MKWVLFGVVLGVCVFSWWLVWCAGVSFRREWEVIWQVGPSSVYIPAWLALASLLLLVCMVVDEFFFRKSVRRGGVSYQFGDVDDSCWWSSVSLWTLTYRRMCERQLAIYVARWADVEKQFREVMDRKHRPTGGVVECVREIDRTLGVQEILVKLKDGRVFRLDVNVYWKHGGRGGIGVEEVVS